MQAGLHLCCWQTTKDRFSRIKAGQFDVHQRRKYVYIIHLLSVSQFSKCLPYQVRTVHSDGKHFMHVHNWEWTPTRKFIHWMYKSCTPTWILFQTCTFLVLFLFNSYLLNKYLLNQIQGRTQIWPRGYKTLSMLNFLHAQLKTSLSCSYMLKCQQLLAF